MRRGAWHQFGDRSQKLALEVLQEGAGVGVIISPRDLGFSKAEEYSAQYEEAGADIIIDQQFHIPTANVGQLDTYPIASKRQNVSGLNAISDADLLEVADALRTTNSKLNATAVLAPAVVYEAGRQDIADLNKTLFEISRGVANELGLPCYATVFIGLSAITADETANAALSAATSLSPDGWYFGFEFGAGRVPASTGDISRYLRSGLTLAATGVPVLHAYVGPMAPLALACGATGAGVGHSQNLWQFTRARWQPAEAGGGGGDAPPRYFSSTLWGTLIYEDEWALLSADLRNRILTPTPFSGTVQPNPPFLAWDRWQANKHLVYAIAKFTDELAAESDAELVLDSFHAHLTEAVGVHSEIADLGIELRDDTAAYQAPWNTALQTVKAAQHEEFEVLRMLS